MGRYPHRRNGVTQSLRFLRLNPIVTNPVSEMSSKVNQLLAHNAYDVVIASTTGVATYALSAKNVPVKVIEEHNTLSRLMKERFLQQKSAIKRLFCWLSWQKSRVYEARTFRRFDLCTMVSEQDEAFTREILGPKYEHVKLVPNGVDCAYHRPETVQAHDKLLIFSGSLTYDANFKAMQFFLDEVYPRIRAQEPEIKLVITGSLEGVSLERLSLDDSVLLTGFVDDVRDEIRRAMVSIVPVRHGGGTRLKVLEAMALGVPVVSTSKGVEGLNVRDKEHLLIADDPEAFAQQTLELVRSEALRQKLAVNARLLVERNYDWYQIGMRFVNLVEETALSKKTH